MSTDVIVWNTDVRNRPELEVEIVIVMQPADVPGEHYAHSQPALEVELLVVDDAELPPVPERLFETFELAQWSFDKLVDLGDDDDDLQLIYDAPPPGYRHAFAAA